MYNISMQDGLLLFLSSAVLISLSGAFSPGPMTAAVIQHGSASRHSGFYAALGHGVIEAPLILIIYLGAATLFTHDLTRMIIGTIGGLYLLYIGKGLLLTGKNAALNASGGGSTSGRTSFIVGITLSVANPYFLLWWATIGLGLVISAEKFGNLGIALFILVHWLCDLLWLTLLSHLAFRGVRTFGHALYRNVSILCGLAMLGFGAMFLWHSAALALDTFQ